MWRMGASGIGLSLMCASAFANMVDGFGIFPLHSWSTARAAPGRFCFVDVLETGLEIIICSPNGGFVHIGGIPPTVPFSAAITL